MSAWDVSKSNNEEDNDGTINITFEKDGGREDFEFDEYTTLFNAVKEIADREGLTAVNVLVNGMEINETEGKKELREFRGKQIKMLPKNSGS